MELKLPLSTKKDVFVNTDEQYPLQIIEYPGLTLRLTKEEAGALIETLMLNGEQIMRDLSK